MVGKGILLECLDHKDITEVLSVGRKSVNLDHPKLKELIHADFSEFKSVKDQLTEYDACFSSMGVSAAELSETEYKKRTYDFTMALAEVLYDLNPNITFCYVSGQGTDSSEKGRVMWARVKGKTENDLLKIGFKGAYMYRPGGIIPLRGVEPSSKLYRMLVKNLKWLLYFFKWIAPNSIVDSTQIGLSMIEVAKSGYTKSILNPKDIIISSKSI